MNLETDIADFKAVGHGLVSLFNVAIILAIVAVVLSARSGTPAIISTFFGFVSWLVGQVVQPVSGGSNVTLGNTLQPAGGYGTSGASGGSGAGQSGSGGSGGFIDSGSFDFGGLGSYGDTGGLGAGNGAATPSPVPNNANPGNNVPVIVIRPGQQ